MDVPVTDQNYFVHLTSIIATGLDTLAKEGGMPPALKPLACAILMVWLAKLPAGRLDELAKEAAKNGPPIEEAEKTLLAAEAEMLKMFGPIPQVN
jgi:uncharacterized protein YhdP